MSDTQRGNSARGPALLTPVLDETGPWTYAYVEGPGPEPRGEEEARQDAVRRRLIDAGAPEEDIEAIGRVLSESAGLPAPSARYVVARRGAAEIDAALPGARIGPDAVGFGDVPPVLPLLRHRSDEVSYLVVEAGRDGSRLRRETVGRQVHAVEEVGDGEAPSKVHAGGLSHARYQRSAEESWKANQREVAETVDRIVREEEPDFVVVAGDVRARQLLLDDLSEASLALAVELDVHTRPKGADDHALDSAIADEVEQRREELIAEVRDRAEAGGGRRGAHGVDEVVAALQQARVDTLVLDARMLSSERTLDALPVPPWVDDGDSLSVGALGRISAAEALARAALMTDARVLIDEDEPDADDVSWDDREPRDPLALLRWAED